MNLKVCYHGGNSSGDSGYWLGFDYDAEMVETLKRKIPHVDRIWDDQQKLWFVKEAYDETLCKLFSNFYALAHLQGKLEL